MNCPKCNSEMESRSIDQVEVDICTKCAGLFLDDGEFESFTGIDPSTGFVRLAKFAKVLSKLNERAIIDELTGAYTRKYFNQFMESVFENTKRGPVTLLGVDIDFFKKINTDFGHDGGDLILKEVARLMRLVLRTSRDDHLFRLGGEEFVIVLFGLNREDSYYAAEMIRRVVGAQPIRISGQEVFVTLSLGVALARPDDTVESFYKRGDELLYNAKNSGRNRVVVQDA